MHGKRVMSATVAAVTGLTGGLLALSATPAQAVGGNCQSRVGTRAVTGPDLYRPEGYCTSLQADSRARGALDLAGAPDAYTPWFTATRVWRVGTFDDYIGVRGSYHEIRAV